MSDAPAISVLIVTLFPWPACEDVLRSCYREALDLGGEVVLVDGHGEALPPGGGEYPAVRWIRMPGATLHQATARSLEEGRADILATTEDHCVVAPGWCRAILAAHREDPAADVIGGALTNGADRTLGDWAAFLITCGNYLPPVKPGRNVHLCGRANLSFKRRALPLPFPPEGVQDYTLRDEIHRRGGVLSADPRPVVAHVQPMGMARATRHHLLAGRSSRWLMSAGLPATERRWKALRMLLTAPFAAVRDSLRMAARVAVRKPSYRGIALAAWPAMLVLRLSHLAGEVLALAAGPGSERWALR